jgi:membrane protein YdbS with pleckstrin-like domain
MSYYNYNSDRESGSTAKGGVGVTGLLGVAFIVLKLVGVINWSWLWVLSPFWVTAALVILLLIIYVVLSVIDETRKERARERRRKK